MQPQRLRYLAPRQTAREACGRANSPQPRYDRRAATQACAFAPPRRSDQEETLSNPIGRTSWWRPQRGRALLYPPLHPGADRNRHRHPAGPFLSQSGRADEAARRRLRETDQDDDRAHHLLHRRARHRQHGGHEEGRTCRPQSIDLLRSGNHARAHRRTSGGQRSVARRRAPRWSAAS